MITKGDFLEKPINDNKCSYNVGFHEYILKLEYANYNTALKWETLWRGTDNAKWFLEWVSHTVYAYIFMYKDSKYKKEMEYFLSHSQIARESIITILLDVCRYCFQDGGLFMAYTTGINLSEMKSMTIELNKSVGIIAQQKIKNSNFGERLLRYNININETFNEFNSLKTYLLNNNYITQEQYDEIEDYYDIEQTNEFKIIKKPNNTYIFEDLKSMNKYMESYTRSW